MPKQTKRAEGRKERGGGRGGRRWLRGKRRGIYLQKNPQTNLNISLFEGSKEVWYSKEKLINILVEQINR